MPIDRIDPWDFNRCYVLPAGVLTNNIPRHRTPGSLGAHEAARGLLVEVCRSTGARPNAVFHTAEEVREPHTWGTRGGANATTIDDEGADPDPLPQRDLGRRRAAPDLRRRASSFAEHSFLGCALCDPVIAAWCLAGGPSITDLLRSRFSNPRGSRAPVR